MNLSLEKERGAGVPEVVEADDRNVERANSSLERVGE